MNQKVKLAPNHHHIQSTKSFIFLEMMEEELELYPKPYSLNLKI